MKKILLTGILIAFLTPATGGARTLEVDVHGLTCAFCVDSLERAFRKIETVRDIKVSLERKKIRLETEGELPDDATIRQTILDAGFTPVRITDLPNAATE